METRPTECDDFQLAVLLSGSERSDAYRQSAAHLEVCEHCHDRLTALAADGETWEEISTILRDYDTPDHDAPTDTDGSELASSPNLKFLAPPAHPEMLGRLEASETRSPDAATNDIATKFGQAKACILLFMWGGPAHQDTLDLKPQAPVEIRGEFSPIATNVPGIQIGEHFPLLAERTDRLCLIRSMTRSEEHTSELQSH